MDLRGTQDRGSAMGEWDQCRVVDTCVEGRGCGARQHVLTHAIPIERVLMLMMIDDDGDDDGDDVAAPTGHACPDLAALQ